MARMTVLEGTRVPHSSQKGRRMERPPDAHPNPTGTPNGRGPAPAPRPTPLVPGGTRINPNVGPDGEELIPVPPKKTGGK